MELARAVARSGLWERRVLAEPSQRGVVGVGVEEWLMANWCEGS